MSDYVFLFRSTFEGQQAAMGTPEAAQKSLQTWLAWMRDLEAKGHLKNPGQPLEPGGKVVRKDKMITDGPYAEVKDLVLGYMVVSASDLNEASELAEGCPIVKGGGSVEVRPIRVMNY
jgi:hypothetical protein